MTDPLMVPTKYILKELLLTPFSFLKRLLTRGKRKQRPDDEPLPKVIIHLEGGLVQAVYSELELDIQVYDLDMPDFATRQELEEAKTLATDFESRIQDPKQVY
ncbi:MAG: hypothetical protein M8357_16325 [Desulfobulbaceae bacterium]|nr:hypothetical protein [Desulfobulbaceae bacterium]